MSAVLETAPQTRTRGFGRGVPTGVSLAALSLGGLAIGTTEFASMGVLPGFAADLGVSVPTAGVAISAYALGVVVGAPLIAIAGARWARKKLILALATALVVFNASPTATTQTLGGLAGRQYQLSDVQANGADPVVKQLMLGTGRQAVATRLRGRRIF